MTSEPQETTERETTEHDEPNEYGFAGGATTPTPEPSSGESFGEAVAVPAGDITGSLMGAIDGVGARDEDDEPEKG
jgi:hypothetical protein